MRISDWSSDVCSSDLERLQVSLEPEIGHHRRDHATALQTAVLRPGAGDHAEDLVAVVDLADLVGPDQPVVVAVEGEADTGALLDHPRPHRLRLHGPGRVVYVDAVRRHTARTDQTGQAHA